MRVRDLEMADLKHKKKTHTHSRDRRQRGAVFLRPCQAWAEGFDILDLCLANSPGAEDFSSLDLCLVNSPGAEGFGSLDLGQADNTPVVDFLDLCLARTNFLLPCPEGTQSSHDFCHDDMLCEGKWNRPAAIRQSDEPSRWTCSRVLQCHARQWFIILCPCV